MTKIKDVLLAQYIGAILIGLIAAQGFTGLIQIVVDPMQHWIVQRVEGQGSVLGGGSSVPDFQWELLIAPLVRVVLHLVVAFLLLRWLYLKGEAPTEEESVPESEQ